MHLARRAALPLLPLAYFAAAPPFPCRAWCTGVVWRTGVARRAEEKKTRETGASCEEQEKNGNGRPIGPARGSWA